MSNKTKEVPQDILDEANHKFSHDGIFSSGSDYEIADEIAEYKKYYIKGRMDERQKWNDELFFPPSKKCIV